MPFFFMQRTVKRLQTVNTQSLTIDIRKRTVSSAFVDKVNTQNFIPQFVQGDTNIVEVTVKDGDTDADLSNVGNIIGNFKRQDGQVFSRSATFSGNVVTYELGNSEMGKSGIGELELQFFNTDSSERLSTLRFKVNVTAEIGLGLEGNNAPTLTQELLVSGDYAKEQGDYAKVQADNLSGEITSLNEQLADIAIDLTKYGAIGDGITDCLPAFNAAIADINSSGGGTIYLPYSSLGYKFSDQILLTDKTILDFKGNNFVIAGTLTTDQTKSLIKVNGKGNEIRNVYCNSIYINQHLIEFGNTSSHNIEFNCEVTRGLTNLIKLEQTNENASTNRSMTLDSFSKADYSKNNSKLFKVTDAEVLASGQLKNFTFVNFPSNCRIKRIIITDNNGSPDLYANIYKDNGSVVKVWERARTTSNIDVTLDLNYFKTDLDDTLKLRIGNYKATSTTFTVEIWFEESVFFKPKKKWQYLSENDFLRPHKDNVGTLTTVSEKTVKAIEYRYKTVESGTTIKRLGITPVRSSNKTYPLAIIPSDPNAETQDKTYSQLKFYFNFSALEAKSKEPKNFVFTLKEPPKNISASAIVGWISQNKDGDAGHLKTSLIYPNHAPCSFSMLKSEGEKTFIFPLDPKSYQLGTTLTSDISFDFFYFILETSDISACFEFNEVYQFDAYFV
jgi:hypothetical protein